MQSTSEENAKVRGKRAVILKALVVCLVGLDFFCLISLLLQTWSWRRKEIANKK